MFTNQKLKTLAYTLITILLLLAAAYLYSKGLSKKSESFGLGLSYVLPGVACLGLAIVTGIIALLESASAKQHRVSRLTDSRQPSVLSRPSSQYRSSKQGCNYSPSGLA